MRVNKKQENMKMKGFTLMEVLVAMFIFVLMISASIISLANVFGAYRETKELQEHIDNAQYSMNLMMKSLRTSSVVDSSDSSVTVFDYSRGECVQYSFHDETMSLLTRSVASDYDTCKEEVGIDDEYSQMTSGLVSGKFWAEESSSTGVGGVTVLMRINPGGDNEIDIQSSVSLRDYKVSEIELGI